MKHINIDHILELTSFGCSVILQNGMTFKRNLDNDIIFSYKEDTRIVSEYDIDDIVKNLVFWQTKNGRYIDINHMTTNHIKNTIKHLGDGDGLDILRSALRSVLRDREIDSVLEKENYGLYNLE